MPPANNKQKVQSPAPAAAQKPAPAVSVKSTAVDAEPKTKSIFLRPMDLFFAIAYLLFALSQLVVLTVRCTDIVPASVTTTVCPLVSKFEGPLSLPVHTYHAWSQKVFTAKSTDALNHATTVNVLFLAPIALVLSWAFLRGCGCAKNLGLLHSAGLLYSMYMLYSAGSDAIVNGKHNVKGGDVATFFGAVLGFYFFFPIAVILRVWQDKPFTNAPAAKSGFFIGTLKTVIKLVFFFWLVIAVVAYYEFAVKNVKAAKDLPSVVDATAENWKTIEPHVAEYTQGALDTAVKVSKDAYEQASTIAADLGKQVEDFISKATKKE